MPEEVLERTIASYMATEQPQYIFGWQGGEPTLLGLDFFRRVVDLERKYGKAGCSVGNGLQTNALLIDEEWARHLGEYNFLVGISLDGPAYIHDRYRKYVNGRGSHSEVLQAIERLRRNRVQFNILTLVNNINVRKGKEVYNYLCDNEFFYHQYVECVEFDRRGKALPFTVSAEEWGNFLCEIYDQWIGGDTRRVSVRLFDSILTYLTESTRTVCKMGENCCQYFVVEYNGDIYPCDFFVQPELKIGNVRKGTWNQFRESTTYLDFGRQKGEWNPQCQECEYLVYCSGDCLKNRFPQRKDPRQLSSLCKGWKMFYGHALPGLQKLAEEIKREGRE